MSANDKRTVNSYLSAFFILTFAFTWFFWLIGILTSLDIIASPVPSLVWVVIGAHGPLVASFWLTYKASGLPAVAFNPGLQHLFYLGLYQNRLQRVQRPSFARRLKLLHIPFPAD